MIVLANLLGAIAMILEIILRTMGFFVIVSAIISWVNPDPFNPIVRFLTAMTEPLLRPIRKVVPLLGGRVDISPLILLLLIYFVQFFLVSTLSNYADVIRHEAMVGIRTT